MICPTNKSTSEHVPDQSAPRENVAALTKFAPLAHMLLLLRRRLRQSVHAKPVPYS